VKRRQFFRLFGLSLLAAVAPKPAAALPADVAPPVGGYPLEKKYAEALMKAISERRVLRYKVAVKPIHPEEACLSFEEQFELCAKRRGVELPEDWYEQHRRGVR